MELRHLRYFAMAAEELNISHASARLNISQPAVSRQIKDLEQELGVQLFERLRDGLKLTHAGHTALAHAHEVLRQSGAMEEAMAPFRKSQDRIPMAIGYIPTALPGFLANGLRQFTQDHGHIRIQIFEMAPREQEKALRDNRLDLALLGTPCPELKQHYRVRVIREVPLAIILPAGHALASRKKLALSELANERFVTLHEAQFPGRPAMMKDLFGQAGIAPEIVEEATGLSELLGLVGAGAGVAVAPADLDQLPHIGVRFITLKHPTLMLVSSAVWKAERETPELLALVGMMERGSTE